MIWKKIKFADFLKERKGLLEPNNTKLFNYKKIDKIDFAKGNLFLTEYSPSKTKQIIVFPNDFVFSGLNIEKGAVTINTTGEQLVVSANYSTCEVDYSVIDLDFFLLFMKSLTFKNLLKENLKKDYGFTRPKHLDQITFFIPSSLEEQRNLVKLANKNTQIVDEISSETNLQINFTKKLRQQLLQDAVQGKLVPQNSNDEPASELLKKIKAEKQKLISEGKLKKEKELPPIKVEEIPFEIPEGWVWCRLGALRDNLFSLSYGVLVPGNDVPNGVPFIRVQDLDFANKNEMPIKHISPTIDKQYAKTRLVGGEILICVVGSIGKVALSSNSWIGANIARAVCRYMTNPNVSRQFLFYCLRSPFIQNFFQKGKKSINPTLNVSVLETTLIPLPPLAEQHRIVKKLDELMQTCDALEASIKESASQNEKLLQQVLREALRKEEVEL